MRTLGLLAGLWLCAAVQAQDHVGQPVPKYVTGDECLFCHREGMAATWQHNAHALTIHPNENGDGFVLGARPPGRSLKEDGYGKFDLLGADKKTWDKENFELRCAGCHSTAVDPKTHAFSTSSLDCYTCHGVVPENHGSDTALVWFSKRHDNASKLVVSICGQCHLRGGKSRSSGLPYPNNFVAGDDLFRDFEVDFAKVDDPDQNPGDRHIYRNARDVIRNGGSVNCISCHKVHDNSTARHRFLAKGPICLDCHNASGPMKDVKKYAAHSALCEY